MSTDSPLWRAQLAVDGFQHACERFRAVHTAVDPRRVMMPLVEALWWSVSADEEFDNADQTGYRSRRNSDADGQVMQGIRYVRNRCGHQRAVVVRRQGGLTVPFTVPIKIIVKCHWRPVDQLPAADNARYEIGREEYASMMAGQEVRTTLEHIAIWFASELKRLERAQM